MMKIKLWYIVWCLLFCVGCLQMKAQNADSVSVVRGDSLFKYKLVVVLSMARKALGMVVKIRIIWGVWW